ncbi:hypothetical protein [Rubellimicrobium arenae]|uniref:hypothetical protein n=1 Tax=Rubellimicrobium arenae TaxID=2817372 RepID=UPI001B316790|nr:hypothetical protein [Rubellimicrobium arenae]
MPNLIRLYILNVFAGFGLAVTFVALLLVFDVGGLRHLVLETKTGWLGGVMLVVFNGIVFAGVQFGIAIMRMAADEDGTPPGGRSVRPSPAMALVEVPVTRDRR